MSIAKAGQGRAEKEIERWQSDRAAGKAATIVHGVTMEPERSGRH